MKINNAMEAALIVKAADEMGLRSLLDAATLKLTEDALRRAESAQLGAEAQKRAAMVREAQAARVATALINNRTRPFTSYWQLAREVARVREVELKAETLRKLFAGRNLLFPPGVEGSG